MSIKKRLVVILIFLILMITGFFSYLIYQKKIASKPILTKLREKTEKTYPEDLKGKVYLTMKESMTNRYGLFYYDFATQSLIEEKIVDDCLILGGEMNYAGTERAVSNDCNEKKESQIFAFNESKQNKQITKNPETLKKEAVWSDDGTKIAFMAMGPDLENKIENWQIVTSDLEGNEKMIAKEAVHPFFSPDGKKILALKKEGLFLFDTENQTEKNIHTFKTEAPISLQFDLSRKKDLLVVSNPTDRDITIFRINSWDDFQMEEINKIETKNTYVSWPKFDPNSDKYIITEEIDDNGNTELIAYNLETKARYFIEDLSFYLHNALWINDWR